MIRTLWLVYRCWRVSPSLRLGQLMVNVLGEDPFYLSDEEVKEKFKHYLHLHKSQWGTNR